MMRPSEALALGRVLLRPVAGIIRNDRGGGCALGMMQAAAPLEEEAITQWMLKTRAKFPCGCVMGKEASISDITMHLFDGHVEEADFHNYHVEKRTGGWNIDKLVDWLRKVEDESKDFEKVTETTECTDRDRALVGHS